MNPWNRCSPRIRKVFYSIAFILLLACVDSGDDGVFTSYFQPESSTMNQALLPYHFSTSYMYHDIGWSWYGFERWDTIRMLADDNLLSWRHYCNDAVAVQEIAKAFNGDSTMPFRVSDALSGQLHSLDTLPFLKYLAQHNRFSALNYISFALHTNEVERNTRESYWDTITPIDPKVANSLGNTAIQKYNAESDPFFKDRYAFQAIKLASEIRDLDGAIHLYDKFFGTRDDDSAIRYWALGRKARSIFLKQDTAQAIYLYAQIFDRSPSKQFEAYMSLRLNEVTFKPEALTYCKNARERAAIYALCAIQPFQQSLDFMRLIVTDYPQSDLLELVMAREINKNEYFYYDWNKSRYMGGYDTTLQAAQYAQSRNYFEQLRQFALECAKNPTLHDTAFWFLTASYIEFVRGDYANAEVHLALADRATTTNPIIKDQIGLQRLLYYVAQLGQIRPENEDKIQKLLGPYVERNPFRYYEDDYLHPHQHSLQHWNAFKYACEHIATLYDAEAHSPHLIKGGFGCSPSTKQIRYPQAKAFLLRSFIDRIDDSVSDGVVDETIAFAEDGSPSAYDKWLLKADGRPKWKFYELRGFRAVQQQDYPTAVRTYSHVPDSVWSKEPYKPYLQVNPFWTGIRDVHTPVPSDRIKYNPLRFAQHMIDLQAELQNAKGERLAQINSDLGCATYNMTPYGTAWLLRSRTEGYDSDTALSKLFAQSRSYFERVITLTSNLEIQAKATFMVAKCEQKQFFLYCDSIGRRPEYEDHDTIEEKLERIEKNNFRSVFKRFHDLFSSTKFHEEVVKECAYYRDYIGEH